MNPLEAIIIIICLILVICLFVWIMTMDGNAPFMLAEFTHSIMERR